MPGVVYLKEAHDTTRTELVVGDIVEEMVVSDLKAAIERKTAIPVAEQGTCIIKSRIIISSVVRLVVWD